METAITVTGLKKSYKKVEVLKDVSFTVKKGSIFALLGSNGAGKTTTINILTTLIKADAGKASVNGNDVATQAPAVRAGISLTGQFAAVDDVLTARENLVLIAQLRHIKQPNQIATQLLEQFDLVDAGDRRVATFSGGMRRRLDIAMSLIGNPDILFLDEPTTGLDPESRMMMWKKIKELAAQGTTIFLTTQYLEEADQLADQIAILHKGTIVAQGTAIELKKLLPQGQLHLRFADAKSYGQAKTLLAKLQAEADDLTSTLIIGASDMKKIATIFSELDKRDIEVMEFSQSQPSLDDVFMNIINKDKEAK